LNEERGFFHSFLQELSRIVFICQQKTLESGVPSELPLILSGPVLRRVEKDRVAVWLALHKSSTVRLSLWENQIKASDANDQNVWFRTPEPGVKTVRVGESLHIIVISLKLPPAKELVPERLYSYDVEITAEGDSTRHTLGSLGLLQDNPENADPDGEHVKHLALGFETGLLPCLLLSPKRLEDLNLAHGSCRNIDTGFPDGLAWLDDLFRHDKAYTSALKRPHQLFLTGDQIYADEVPRPLLKMLNDFASRIFGSVQEQLPLKKTDGVELFIADLHNFPAGRRHNLILNECGMTTTCGESHLMSFREFCAMYLFVWSNECWSDIAGLPSLDAFKTAELAFTKLDNHLLNDAINKNAAGESVTFANDSNDDDNGGYGPKAYRRDIARLTEFHRTLPKVRRALANVPAYMIFDDHEITDDWYLTHTWRDRVMDSALGSAILRNGMVSYALFQGWGNDPVKFEPRAGITEKQPHEQLLEQIPAFVSSGGVGGPGTPADAIADLLGLGLRNDAALDGSYAETNPKLKWTFTVPGEEHQVLFLDCRTRRAFASRISPPGNIGLTAQAEQIPETPDPKDRRAWIVVSSLPVIGPPIFDELFAPLLVRVFDAMHATDLQKDRGTRRAGGTNPDAVEAWCFDPKLFEALLKRLVPYSPVILLSGDVHYSATNAMSYWFKKNKTDADLVKEPARFIQFVSSGMKNVMPEDIVLVTRSFAVLQDVARKDIGGERLAWEKNSPMPVELPGGSDVSPRLRSLLRKSPVVIPAKGWRGAKAVIKPDWAWRVCPVRDVREDKERPPMAQPSSLFPDAPSKKDQDIDKTDLEGYERVAQRHARQLDRQVHSRQILFASNLGIVRFETRKEKIDGQDVDMTYAIQDLYTIHRDPENLIAPPKPLVYTRHEAALRDLQTARPEIKE
jgi:hypothetical protein